MERGQRVDFRRRVMLHRGWGVRTPGWDSGEVGVESGFVQARVSAFRGGVKAHSAEPWRKGLERESDYSFRP